MAKIGDFFPDDMQESIADGDIVCGTVIRLYTILTTPPKIKRFIILGRDENNNLIGTVFINTNINWKVINNSEELLNLQYPVRKINNDYLDIDSFVDYSKIIHLSLAETKNRLIKSKAIVMGKVNDEDIIEILNLVRSSPNVSPIELKNIGIV